MRVMDHIRRCLIICFFALSASALSAEEKGVLSKYIDFSIGGRFKLDGIYSSRSSQSTKDTSISDITFSPASIPLDNSAARDKYTMDVRGSRIWTIWHVPTPNRDISAYLEVDFLSVKNESGGGKLLTGLPRLRHYYLNYEALTLGQTYTSFLNISSFPEINDINGPLGVLVVRQRLVRYSHAADWGRFIFSLEDSETRLTTASGAGVTPDNERYPDIVGKFVFTGNWGNSSLSWLLREIRNKELLPATTKDQVWGAAVNLAGRLHLMEQDTLRFSISYGNVLGRYLSYATFADGVLDGAGKIHLNPIIGGNVSYQHWWTDTLRSNIALGSAYADNPVSVMPSSANKRLFSSHINLLWSPEPDMTVGIEWLYAWREREDGEKGQLARIQLSAIYRF